MSRFTHVFGAMLVVLAMLAPSNAAATPVFVRQTGLSCNQCHMSNTPTPDFTFTGMKFRLNAWRAPWTAARIESGEEGKLSGKRLNLNAAVPLNFHIRTIMFQQSKGSYAVGGVAPAASSVSGNPQGTVAMTFAGPINDYFGHWNELYIYDRAQCVGVTNCIPSRQGQWNLNHWDLRAAFNPGGIGNIVGLDILGNPSGNHHFFAMHADGEAPNLMLNAPGTSRYLLVGAHTLIADRFGLMLGVEPGEDNWDYAKRNYQVHLGMFVLNTDNFWFVPNFRVKWGNDMVPGVGSLAFNADGRSLRRTDAISGVSAARVAAGGPNAPYGSPDMGDGTRWALSLPWGFLDRGAYSSAGQLGFAGASETYADLAKYKETAVSYSQRFFYDRTYGIRAGVSKYFTRQYTDPLGRAYDVPASKHLRYGFDLIWRWSQNQSWYFSWQQNSSTALTTDFNPGWSWSLNLHWAL